MRDMSTSRVTLTMRQLRAEAVRAGVLSTSNTENAHQRAVRAVAVLPDGRSAVSAGTDESIRLWCLQTHVCKHVFPGHNNFVSCVAVSEDGNFVASGSGDTTVKVWSLGNHKCVATLAGHANAIASVAFSPDGDFIVSGSLDFTVRVWDWKSRKCVATLRGHNESVECIAVSATANPHRRHLLLRANTHGPAPGKLGLTPGRRRATGMVHTSDAGSEHFTICSGDKDGTVRVWTMPEGQCVATIHAHTKGVESVAVSPDGRQLVTASEDATAKLWSLDLRSCKSVLRGHHGSVHDVTFSPHGNTVLTCGADATVRLWSVESSACLAVFRGHQGTVSALDLTPSGHFIVSGGFDASVRIWALLPAPSVTTTNTHTRSIESVAITPDGGSVVSCSTDENIKISSLPSLQCMSTLTQHTDGVFAVAVSDDGRLLASGSDDTTIRTWDLAAIRGTPAPTSTPSSSPSSSSSSSATAEGGGVLQELHGHTATVTCLMFTANSTHLVSGSVDTTVRVWSMDSGKCAATLTGHSTGVYALAYAQLTEGSDLIASGSEDGVIKLWDGPTASCIATLDAHVGDEGATTLASDISSASSSSPTASSPALAGRDGVGVSALAFTPDTTRLVSAGDDGTIRLWSVSRDVVLLPERVSCVAVVRAHEGSVTDLAAAADSAHVVSAGEDGLIKIWRLQPELACLCSLEGHVDRACAVAISGDMQRIVSAGATHDHTLRVWPVGAMLAPRHSSDVPHVPTFALTGTIAHDRFSEDGTQRLAALQRCLTSFPMTLHCTMPDDVNMHDDLAVGQQAQWHVQQLRRHRTRSKRAGGDKAGLNGGGDGRGTGAQEKRVDAVETAREGGTGGASEKRGQQQQQQQQQQEHPRGFVENEELPGASLSDLRDAEHGGVVTTSTTSFSRDQQGGRPGGKKKTVHWQQHPYHLAQRRQMKRQGAGGRHTSVSAQHEDQQAGLTPLAWAASNSRRQDVLACMLATPTVPLLSLEQQPSMLHAAITEAKDIEVLNMVTTKIAAAARARDRGQANPADHYPWELSLLSLNHCFTQDLMLLVREFPDVAARFMRDLGLVLSGTDVGYDHRATRLPTSRLIVVGDEHPVQNSGLWQSLREGGELAKLENVNHHTVLTEARVVPVPFAASYLPDGTTLLDTLVEAGRADLFGNFIARSVVRFKWETFGRRKFRREANWYLLSVAFITILTFVVNLQGTGVRALLSSSASAADVVSVVMVLMLGMYACAEGWHELREWRNLRGHWRDFWNWLDSFNILMAFVVLGTYLGGWVHARAVLALASYLRWFGLLYHLQAFKTTGPLVRMVLAICYDMRYFLLVLGISIVAAWTSFRLLLLDDESVPLEGLGDPANGLLTMFSMLLLSEFELDVLGGQYRVLLRILFVFSMVLVPVVLLNLLIALMSDSYERIQDRADVEFQLLRARYLRERELFLTPSEKRDPRLFPKWLHVLVPKGTGTGESTPGEQWQGMLTMLKQEVRVQSRTSANDVKARVDELGARLASVEAQVKRVESSMSEQVAALQHDSARIISLLQEGRGGAAGANAAVGARRPRQSWQAS